MLACVGCSPVDPVTKDAGDAGASDTQTEPCDDPYAVGATPANRSELDETVCFFESPPGPGDQIAELPMPDASCCKRPRPLFFKGDGPVPAPTLQVELGTSSPTTGNFVPWKQGLWVPMEYGNNGGSAGFHISVAFRVVLPGHDEAKVKLKVQARGNFACKETAFGVSPVIWVRQDGELDEGYTNASPLKSGMRVAFAVKQNMWFQYCGIWVDMHLAVQDVSTGAWGEASRMVRTYQSIAKMK